MNYEDMKYCFDKLNAYRNQQGLSDVVIRSDDEMFRAIVDTIVATGVKNAQRIEKNNQDNQSQGSHQTKRDNKSKRRPKTKSTEVK